MTSDKIRSLLALVSKKEALAAEIAAVEKELLQALTGKSAVKTADIVKAPKAKKARKTRKSKGGTVGDAILAALKDGPLSTSNIVTKTGKKSGSVVNWLATTGKKSGQIERAERGIYRLKA